MRLVEFLDIKKKFTCIHKLDITRNEIYFSITKYPIYTFV